MRRSSLPVSPFAIIATILLAGCGAEAEAPPVGGDPEAGAVLLSAHACGACHVIPGVVGADGTIGPTLEGFGNRAFIAGRLPNQLANLTRWIQSPQSIEPGSAMPSLPVNDAEARAMAAYLYSLR